MSNIRQVFFLIPSSFHRKNELSAKKNGVYTTPIIKANSNTSSSSWSKIHMYLGVNQNFERVLAVVFYPTVVLNEKSIFQGIVGKSKANANLNASSFNSFVVSFLERMCEQFQSRQLTISQIVDKNINIPSNEGTKPAMIEPSYIRDLQLAFAQRMVLQLTNEFSAIDSRVKAAELRCARMMTLLRPSYQLAGKVIQQAPKLPAAPPSLSSYPLKLPPKRNRSIMEPDAEECKLLLLRARRLFRDWSLKAASSSSDSLPFGEDIRKAAVFASLEVLLPISDEALRHKLNSLLTVHSGLSEEAQFVLRQLFSHFGEWLAQEHEARMARKKLATSERCDSSLW